MSVSSGTTSPASLPVYLAMTGGQVTLALGGQSDDSGKPVVEEIKAVRQDRPALRVVQAIEAELEAHEAKLAVLDKAAGEAVWRKL